MKNNYIYLYNNSFISLLNLFKTLSQNNIVPLNIKSDDYTPTLFDELVTLDISDDEKIISEIINYISPNVLNILYYVFISNVEEKELLMYYFFLNSLKYRHKVIYMRNLKSVTKSLKIAKYVSNETHKLKGFLRFKELENNLLYAEIAPENNILFLLSKHFKNRLKNEYWLIKDTKRNILSLYDKKEFYLINGENFIMEQIKLSSSEENIEKLWKKFYQTIGIQERKNERCRMNFMPKKYWQYIIEMSDEYENVSN